MKEIKKESLKSLSKNNLINSILVLLIRTSINIYLLITAFCLIYVISEYTFPFNTFFHSILYPIATARHLNKYLLVSLFSCLFLFSFIVFIPLKMGIYLWFSKIKKDNKQNILIIFNYYSSLKIFLRAVTFKLVLLTKSILAFTICFVPTVGTFIFACSKLNQYREEHQFFLRILIIFSAITILIGGFFFLKIQLTQIPAKFMFVTNDTANIIYIIKSAHFLTNSNINLLMHLVASFYYHIFAFIFIIPIPFITSYFYVCLNEYTQRIVYKQNQGISSIPLTEKVVDISSQLLRF